LNLATNPQTNSSQNSSHSSVNNNNNNNRQAITRTTSASSSLNLNKQVNNISGSNSGPIEKRNFTIAPEKFASNMSKQQHYNSNSNNSYINQHHNSQHHQSQHQHLHQYYVASAAPQPPPASSKHHYNLNSHHRLASTNTNNSTTSFSNDHHNHPQRNNSISTLINVNNNINNNNSSSRSNYVSNNTNQHHNQHQHSQSQLHHHNSMQNLYMNNNSQFNNGSSNTPSYNNNYQSNQIAFTQPLPQQHQHIYQKQISLPTNINAYIKQQQQSPPHLVNQNNHQHQHQPANYSSTSSSSSSSIATHSPTSPTSNSLSSISSTSNFTSTSITPSSTQITKLNRTPPPPLTASTSSLVSTRMSIHQVLTPSLLNEDKLAVVMPLLSPKIELEKIDETKALLLSTDEKNIDQELVLDENDEDELVFDEKDEEEEECKKTPIASSSSSAACLADLMPREKDFGENNKLDYFRHVVLAIDRLYPDTKWPLHNTWTFWHIKNDPNQSWEANIKEIVDVSYVEDFWSVANYLYTPMNMLAHGGDITFFKKSIRPMWEDAQNKAGGSWLHTIHQYNKKYPEIYDHWLETLIALIGDNFCGRSGQQTSTSNEHVCDFISGVYASPRSKISKVALWTQNYRDEKTTRLIG
jgi:translation initiation factor 4E